MFLSLFIYSLTHSKQSKGVETKTIDFGEFWGMSGALVWSLPWEQVKICISFFCVHVNENGRGKNQKKYYDRRKGENKRNGKSMCTANGLSAVVHLSVLACFYRQATGRTRRCSRLRWTGADQAPPWASISTTCSFWCVKKKKKKKSMKRRVFWCKVRVHAHTHTHIHSRLWPSKLLSRHRSSALQIQAVASKWTLSQIHLALRCVKNTVLWSQ